MFSSNSPSPQAPINEFSALLQMIEANWPVLPSGIWSSSSIQSLSRHLLQLSRRSEQFGQTALYELVTIIDDQISGIIDGNTPPNRDQIDTLNDSLLRLKHIANNLQSPDTAQAGNLGTIDLIHLPHSQDEVWQIEQAVRSQQWRYRSLSNLQELHDALAGEGARAVLVDTRFLPELSRNPDILRAGNRTRPDLFFISEHFDIETRLNAMRVGARHLFTKPIGADALIIAIRECISPQARPRHRVLIVEDDEAQATFAANLLRKGKLETLAIADPLSVIDSVRRFQPDLILMDLYMPGADGIELTRLIRQRDESVAIPIIFLSGEDDLEKKLLALQAGADDFLTKPARPQQLLATVKTRIKRARAITAAAIQGAQAETEGLPNRRALLSQLDSACEDCKTGQLFHALIVVCLSDLQADPDQWEDEAADRCIEQVVAALKPRIQTDDYLANIGNQRLAILFRRPAKQEVERLGNLVYDSASQWLKACSPEQTRLGIGLALLDGAIESGYEMLCHTELSAASAYQHGIEGYKLCEKVPLMPEEAPSEQQAPSLDQFLHDIQIGSVTIHEQRFACRHGYEGGIETYELAPQHTSPSQADSDPYETAAQCGAVREFDRFVCGRAIERLGEFALRRKGLRLRLIFRQSASVIQDDDYLEFIKTTLHKHHVVGTGLMVDFDLPSLAADLKRARRLISELAALGIGVSLSSFSGNETAYKVLAYLRAEVVRPRLSFLRADTRKIQHFHEQIRYLRAEIILPLVQQHGQIGLQWSESADYIQADFSQ